MAALRRGAWWPASVWVICLAAVTAGCDADASRRAATDGGQDGSADATTDARTEGDAGRMPWPMRPSFVDDVAAALAGTREVVVSAGSNATWNVATGELRVENEPAFTEAPTLEPQGEGLPMLAVFALRSLHVQSGATLRFEGPHAVAVSAAEHILVEGTVDVGARAEAGGPGGASSAAGGGAPSLAVTGARGVFAEDMGAAFAEAGSGGGGNGAAGGAGGAASATLAISGGLAVAGAAGGAGGLAWSAVPGFVPADALVGGGAGGDGACGLGPGDAAPGGGGGGALLLAAQVELAVTSTGLVTAHGAGAPEVVSEAVCDAGAAVRARGGGAGGTVVLEAPVVTLEGGVFAGGGGGAGAGASSATDASLRGKAGEDGRTDAAPAAGGAAGLMTNFGGIWLVYGAGGDGGAGGEGTARGNDGTPVTYARPVGSRGVRSVGGGGGGAVGRIEIRTADGERDDAWPLSPSAAPALLVGTIVRVEN